MLDRLSLRIREGIRESPKGSVSSPGWVEAVIFDKSWSQATELNKEYGNDQ